MIVDAYLQPKIYDKYVVTNVTVVGTVLWKPFILSVKIIDLTTDQF